MIVLLVLLPWHILTVREHFHRSRSEPFRGFLGQKGRHVFAAEVRRRRAVDLFKRGVKNVEVEKSDCR